MKCPACRSHKHVAIDLRSEGFSERIVECRVCGTTWSINHGMAEVVRDTQAKSFLGAATECVEGDDYSWVA